MTEQERDYERERDYGRGPDMDGEELVDGTGGGTENVSDVTRESPDPGRIIGGILVGLVALILLAVPIAWAIGALTVAIGLSPTAAWIYGSLLFLLGVAVAFYAYTLLSENAAYRRAGE